MYITNKRTKGRAGAGKSRKMIEDVMALAEAGLNIQVIVFNKRLQTELSSRIYHENVNVTTFHSIAYNAIGKKVGYPTTYQSVKKAIPSLNTREATILTKLFAMYCQSRSNAKEFAYRVFEYPEVKEYAMEIKSLKSTNDPMVLTGLIDELMDSYQEQATHDTYLKEYQLKNPSTNYDVIVIDEYQDYSEVMISIIESYGKPVYLYGDPDQKIYSFRFATGEFPQEFEDFTLPETNRCPSNVTNLANVFLNILGDDLMVSKIPDGVIIPYENLPVIKENSTLISNYNFFAVMAIMYYKFKVNFDIHIDIKIDKLKEIWDFINKRPTAPDWLKRFASVSHLQKFYHETENINGLTLIKCASVIPNWKEFQEAIDHYDESQPTLTLTNVFVSKGLEWDNVIVAPDFTDIENPSYAEMTYDSIRFLYTAITRSKKNLWIPYYLNNPKPQINVKFIEDTGDLIKQKANEMRQRQSKIACGRDEYYSDTTDIEPNTEYARVW